MLTAIAGTMPSRSVILPMMTPPRPKPKKIMVADERNRAAGGGEFALHHRHHHHDRPHPDRADGGDQHGKRQPHPGLALSQG